jgi:hypothetical protein
MPAQSSVTFEDQRSYAVKLKQQLNELRSAIQISKTHAFMLNYSQR